MPQGGPPASGFALRLIVACFAFWAAPALAQWTDSFESPQTSWYKLSPQTDQTLRRTRRIFNNAIDGDGFEQLEVQQKGKSPILLANRVDPLIVIDELIIQLQVKSSRPGARLGARVTLPHTLDPKTGERASVIVLGEATKEANRWTLLKLENISTLLDSELPILRKRLGKRVDRAEAFVDLVVVEESVGPGDLRIGVDGLVIDGIVFADDRPKAKIVSEEKTKPAVAKAAVNAPAPHKIRTNGGLLEIDEQPSFVRAIESSGEPLEFLKSLGFNAVKLRQPPTLKLDQEARKLGLWLIAPPSFDPQASQKQQSFTSVIAWDLGDDLGERELEIAKTYIAESRRREQEGATVFVAAPKSHHWEWSRQVDLLCYDAEGALGEFSLAEAGRALEMQRALGRPGAPSWSAVHTEPPAALVSQWSAFKPDQMTNVSVSPEQLRLQAFQAILGGARGLVFTSRHRLDGKNGDAEVRATALKWLNLQLELIAPWAATGDASILSKPGEPTVLGAISADRSALVMLINTSSDDQFEVSGAAPKSTRISLSGQSARSPRYQLTWRTLRQLSTSTVRDGGSFAVERTSRVDYLVLASDAAAIRFAADYVQRRQGELAAAQLTVANLWHQQSQGILAAQMTPIATGAEQKLAEAAQWLQKGDHFQSLRSSEEAMNAVANARREIWSRMAGRLDSPLISPLCVSAALSADHSELATILAQQSWSANRLPGGDLENLDRLREEGWLAFQTPDSAYRTQITTNDREPQQGAACLSLSATPHDDHDPTKATAAVTSAGVPVRQGDLVRYRVWVRAGQSDSPQPSRVQFFDNLAGRRLGMTVEAKADWTPVVLYRFAPTDGEAKLTAALLGTGGVDIDQVEVQTISREMLAPPTRAAEARMDAKGRE